MSKRIDHSRMLLARLERTIHDRVPVQTGDRWVIAVSGGPDSLALLHALVQLRDRLGLELHVATFDHQLRGAAGAQDVTFVRQIGAQWGLPVSAGSADVAALANRERLSIEAAARQARYAFLADVARSVGACAVATAHNADDQAETVLMHVLRGAGLAGLSGMRYRARLPGAPDLFLVRPLLDVTRAEVEAYCRQHALKPRYDATNGLPVYLRNRLRLEIMPQLREINPQVARQLHQLAESSAVDNSFIEEALARELVPFATVTADAVSLPRDLFARAHTALQRRFIVWAARQLAPRLEVSYVHLLDSVAVALGGQVGAQATLPAGLRLRVDYDTIVVERAGATPPHDALLLDSETPIPVAVPGNTPVGNWSLRARLRDDPQAAARLVVPAGATVTLRTRRPGDRFTPLGMGGQSQKLKAWLINHKVPQRLRDRLPLLEIDGEIAALVWGERWPVSEQFALPARNGRVVSFYADTSGG